MIFYIKNFPNHSAALFLLFLISVIFLINDSLTRSHLLSDKCARLNISENCLFISLSCIFKFASSNLFAVH